MKRLLLPLFLSAFLLSVVAVSIAQPEEKGMGGPGMQQGMMGQDGKGMMGQGMKERGMMGQGMMGQGMGEKGMMGNSMMCPLCSSMMKSAGSPQLISTGDGGFVVLAGNKLTKYDKDLNVVKEAEIKIDVQAMVDKMKDCPVCKMMKEKKEEKKEMMMEHHEKKMEGK